MSERLTESMRNSITTRLLQHRFDKEEKALRRRTHELAMKVHRLRYSAAERKRMDELPEGWLVTTNKVRVQVPKESDAAYGWDFDTTEPLRIPFADQWAYFDLAKAKGGKDLLDALIAVHKAREMYDNARGAMKHEINKTLTCFGTLARLLKAWPEVKPFTDQLGYDAEKKALPTVIPAALNTRLDLPVSSKA